MNVNDSLLRSLLTKVLTLERRVASPVTPAQIAHVALETLRNIPGGITIAPPTAGPSILTRAQHYDLRSNCYTAAELVKFMTPFLAKLRLPDSSATSPCRPVFMNSELLRWLVHPSSSVYREDQRLKPDCFVSWAPFVEFREGNADAGQGIGQNFSYVVLGSVAERSLRHRILRGYEGCACRQALWRAVHVPLMYSGDVPWCCLRRDRVLVVRNVPRQPCSFG